MLFNENSRDSRPADYQGSPKSAKSAENPSCLFVLVVDDEPLIRWSLNKGLSRRGHNVVEAQDAADALAAIARATARFDVAILDYKLPDRQDLSLLSDVRRLVPTAMVVMMTAYGDDEMRSGAKALGAWAVIDKPFQVHQIISLIESSVTH